MKLLKVLTVCLVYVTSSNCFAGVEGLGEEIEEVITNLNLEIDFVESRNENINMQVQLYIQAQLDQIYNLENHQNLKYESTFMLH